MNLKSVFLYLVIAAGLIAALWWWGGRAQINHPSVSGSPVSTAPQSPLTASRTLYDFGTISMGKGKVSHKFIVTNPTAQAVELTSVSTSCMCTTALLMNPDGSQTGPFGMDSMGYDSKTNTVIKAGGQTTVNVVFDPAAHGPAGVGDIDRLIYLQDKEGRVLTLEIKAIVTP